MLAHYTPSGITVNINVNVATEGAIDEGSHQPVSITDTLAVRDR